MLSEAKHLVGADWGFWGSGKILRSAQNDNEFSN
jgi:hypothetical protein